MASTMTTIALMMMSALAANAANLRSNGSVATFTCGQGWTLYNGVAAQGATGHCYKRMGMTTKKHYHAARIECASLGHPNNPQTEIDTTGARFPSRGSYIAVPNTQAENTFLDVVMNPLNSATTWIGFDASNNDQWEDFSTNTSTDSWRKVVGTGGALGWGQCHTTKPAVYMKSDGSWSFAPKNKGSVEYVCEAAAWDSTMGAYNKDNGVDTA